MQEVFLSVTKKPESYLWQQPSQSKKKKKVTVWISFHSDTVLLSTFGLPLCGLWRWQGWHQRRALTPGELGLPAVSNQIYFEVRDTQTPRAKVATSPAPHPPLTQPATSQPLVLQIAGTAVLVPDVGRTLYLAAHGKWWDLCTGLP